MATSGSIRTNLSSDNDLYLLLEWSSGNQSIGGNYTPIYWELKLVSTQWARVSASAAKNYSVTVDDQTWNGTNNVSISQGQTKTLASGSKDVYHNSNGEKWLSISFYQEMKITYSGKWMEGGGGSDGWSLPTIPRYTTVYNSVRGRTLNTISINWSTTDARDWTRYSINGGAWQDAYDTVASNNKSGYYTISGLQPNTTYRIKTQCRRADSGLWSEAGELTITTYNKATITEAPNFTDEDNPTIKYSNEFGNNVGLLQACISFDGSKADIAYRDVSKTGGTYTFPLTEEERNALRQKATGSTLSVMFFLRTDYNGSSYYSTSTKTLTIINANPTFSAFNYADVNEKTKALTGNNQRIINGYSNITATINTSNKAVAKKYATMSRYVMRIGTQSVEKPYSDSSTVSLALNGVSGSTVNITAYDSRGKTTSKEYSLNPVNYSAIKIASLVAEREGGVGTKVTLKFTAKYWNQSFGVATNKITLCTYRYKLTSSSSYIQGQTKLSFDTSGDTISGSVVIQGDIGADGFDVSSSFDIQLVVADELTTAYANFVLGSGTPAIAIYEDNVAIGQKYDESTGGKLQVAGDTYVQGNLSVKGKALVDLIYPVGAVYLSVNSTSPATLFGGTWEQIKGYYLYATNATSGTAGNKSTFSGTSTTAASGSTGSTAITVDQMPLHSHTGTTNNDGAHVHNSTAYGWMIDGVGNARQAVPEGSSGFGADILIRSYSSEHQHGFTTNGTGGGQGHTHSLNSHTHDVSYVGVFVWKRTA